MAVRAPHIHAALRAFCLAAFAELGRETDAAGELPFVVEEHASGFYEYRPLVRDRVLARAFWLAKLDDARIAIDELRREPAAAIFARAHAGPEPSEGRALYRAILLPLLFRTAEACGGFDWEDGAFNRVYGELERSLYGATRSYTAVAPLVGLSVGAPIEIGRGIAVRASSPDELSTRWPEARDLVPARFGLEPERTCVLELERELPGDEITPPDAPGELADAVTALRLATAAPAAAGPVVFERLDWHPFGIRPMLGIAATEPAGEPTRLDPWRGRLAGELLEHLGESEDDAELGEALERWELALFESEPLRSERLREAVGTLLGGVDGLWAAAMRASVLLGEAGRERATMIARAAGARAGRPGRQRHGRPRAPRDRRDRPARRPRRPSDRSGRCVARDPSSPGRVLFGAGDPARFRHGGVTVLRLRSVDGGGAQGSRPSRTDRSARPRSRGSRRPPGRASGAPARGRSLGQVRARRARSGSGSRRTMPADAGGREQDSASLSRKTAGHNGSHTAHRAPRQPGVDL